MHEMTVVLNIVDIVDDFAEKNDISEVNSVHLLIGGLTGVMPHYVEECWGPAVDMSKHLKKASVVMEEVPGVGKCANCGHNYIVPVCKGVCPVCSSRDWTPVTGKDVQIKEILV